MLNVFQREDGHAQERRLLGKVAATAGPGEVWIEDRNCCALGFLSAMYLPLANVIVRPRANLPFIEETPFVRVCEQEGRVIFEQKIQIDGCPSRRIRVELKKPARDGDCKIDLIADLPDTLNAQIVADSYRKRWTIEISFQPAYGGLGTFDDT